MGQELLPQGKRDRNDREQAVRSVEDQSGWILPAVPNAYDFNQPARLSDAIEDQVVPMRELPHTGLRRRLDVGVLAADRLGLVADDGQREAYRTGARLCRSHSGDLAAHGPAHLVQDAEVAVRFASGPAAMRGNGP